MIQYDSTGNEVGKGAAQALSVTGALSAAQTLTIPAPPAGQYVYITSVYISRAASAALAGSAILPITTSNLPGSMGWQAGNAMAIGDIKIDAQLSYYPPIKASAAATAVSIIAPAPGTGVQWKINATFFYGL